MKPIILALALAAVPALLQRPELGGGRHWRPIEDKDAVRYWRKDEA